MNDASGQTGRKSFWSRFGRYVLGLGSIVVAVGTSLFLAEVRAWTCLDAPKADELRYPEAKGSVSYRELASQSLQPSFDGREVTFNAKAYGEYDRTAYTAYMTPARRSSSIAYVVGTDEKVQEGPFGREMPKVAVLLSPELSKQWSALANGSGVRIDGHAEFLHDAPPGSDMARGQESMRRLGQDPSVMRVPEFADFWVVATRITPLKALNDPRDRLMCRWRTFET